MRHVLSHFVGRSRELAELHELLAQVEHGQGQVVGWWLRLAWASRACCMSSASLTGEADVSRRALPVVWQHDAVPPVLDMLRHHCDITETDGPETITTKVYQGLQEVGMRCRGGSPYLLHLLGVQAGTEGLAVLSPEAIKTRPLTPSDR